MMRSAHILIFALGIVSTFSSGVCADEPKLLRGTVEENELARTRIRRFEEATALPTDHVGHDSGLSTPTRTRLHRAASTNSVPFAERLLPEFAKVDQDLFVKRSEKPYDLEAESNSRELMLAWEMWHKQLAEAMYKRVRIVGEGGCAYKLTITRDHHLSIAIVGSMGSPLLKEEIVSAARSLDGNIGLSFPQGSQRKVVNEYLSIVCGRNVRPGFNWERGDFEKIRQSW